LSGPLSGPLDPVGGETLVTINIIYELL
jgi:hypothetical protein